MVKQFFKNKKVLIMGLGLHGGGVGVVKFFCKQGADVLVTDLKTKEQLDHRTRPCNLVQLMPRLLEK